MQINTVNISAGCLIQTAIRDVWCRLKTQFDRATVKIK